MIGGFPLWLAIIERPHHRGLSGQLPHKHSQPAPRECAAEKVEQVELVVAQEVGLYRVAMLIEQAAEAS